MEEGKVRLRKWPVSERTLLDEGGDTVDDGVFLVFGGIESVFHVHAEETAHGLIEAGAKRAQESLDYVVGVLV